MNKSLSVIFFDKGAKLKNFLEDFHYLITALQSIDLTSAWPAAGSLLLQCSLQICPVLLKEQRQAAVMNPSLAQPVCYCYLTSLLLFRSNSRTRVLSTERTLEFVG